MVDVKPMSLSKSLRGFLISLPEPPWPPKYERKGTFDPSPEREDKEGVVLVPPIEEVRAVEPFDAMKTYLENMREDRTYTRPRIVPAVWDKKKEETMPEYQKAFLEQQARARATSKYTVEELKSFIQPTETTPGNVTDEIQPGNVVRCLTTYVADWDLFYVQRVSDLHLVHQLDMKLSNFYQDADTIKRHRYFTPPKEDLVMGRLFVVRMDDLNKARGLWGSWYRAKVIHAFGNDVLIQLIDYGHIRVVKANSLRKLVKKFNIAEKAYAIPCRFRETEFMQDILTDDFKSKTPDYKQDLGKLLNQFLWTSKGQELVKFYGCGINSKVNEKVWEVSSLVFDCHRPKILLPPKMTLADTIVALAFTDEPIKIDLCSDPTLSLPDHWAKELDSVRLCTHSTGFNRSPPVEITLSPEYNCTQESAFEVFPTDADYEFFSNRLLREFTAKFIPPVKSLTAKEEAEIGTGSTGWNPAFVREKVEDLTGSKWSMSQLYGTSYEQPNKELKRDFAEFMKFRKKAAHKIAEANRAFRYSGENFLHLV